MEAYKRLDYNSRIRFFLMLSGVLVLLATTVGTGVYFVTVRRLVYNEAKILTRDTSEYFGDSISFRLVAPQKSMSILSRMNAVLTALTLPSRQNVSEVALLLEHFRKAHQGSRCLLLDRDGRIVAASMENGKPYPVGFDLSRQPFFQKALAGEASAMLAQEMAAGRGTINLTHPVVMGEKSAGAVVITIPASSVSQGIMRSTGIVALVDEHNIVFASNKQEWLFKVLGKSSAEALIAIAESGKLGGEKPETLDVALDETTETAVLPGGREYLFSRFTLESPPGWQVIYFHGTDQLADRVRAGLFGVTGLLITGIGIFVVCAFALLFFRAETLWRQANHDPLTGLPNRALFMDRLEQARLRAIREERRLLALFFIDLDKFKEVNDRLGHDHGDLLLVEVAHRLTRLLRKSDSVARLGGDELTVILPHSASREEIITVAEKIIDALARPYTLSGATVTISCSIGIALFPMHAWETEALIKAADEAMYQVKDSGRNGFGFFAGEQSDKS